MGFHRMWDASCPREWDRWESGGSTWVIRDLPPEDEEEAMEIMREYFLNEETMCAASGLSKHPETIENLRELLKMALSQRMSLACYEEKDGDRKLAGVNVCVVNCRDDDPDAMEIEDAHWQNVANAYRMASNGFNAFEYLQTDKLLHGFGLIVRPEYRGRGLAPKILLARTPLCKHVGVKGSTTFFSSVASQKSAARAGYTTVFSFTFKDLASYGLNYPPDENVVITSTVKKFE